VLVQSKVKMKTAGVLVACALALGILGVGAVPASAGTVNMTAVIGGWHCSAGGSVVAILGFSNFPNGWTSKGAQPGNRLNIQATDGQNYAYGAVTCRKTYWWGGSSTYHQEITERMYYWGRQGATVNL
jgi:hypothetical protein